MKPERLQFEWNDYQSALRRLEEALLEDRNKTTHVYDAKEAETIYQSIRSRHILQLRDFLRKVGEVIRDEGVTRTEQNGGISAALVPIA